jgi:hypothetical protein
MTELKAVLRLRTGSYEEFYNANQVYDRGEHTHIASGSHAGMWKVGDGITPWRSLSFSPKTAALNAHGVVTGSNDLFFGKINADGTFTLNGIAEAVDRIDTTAAQHTGQIEAIQTQLAGMSGTIIYIGIIGKYTDELDAMGDTARNALLTARAIEIRGQVMEGYTLQDLGMESEIGRFSYWQCQSDGTWFNLGERGEVSQATDSDLGIVMGSGAQYKIHIETDGTMGVNGLTAELQRLAAADEELAANIEDVGTSLSEFERAQEQTNGETAQQIADETERARVAESGLSQQIADEAERAQGAESGLQTAVNSEAQTRAGADGTLQDNIDFLAQSTDADISAEEEARKEADIAVVEAARVMAEARIAKNVFADTNGALVADMAIAPETGSLANISKTLKNVSNGENFTINVHVKSEGGTIDSAFSQQDEQNYTLNLEASKPQAAAEAAQAAADDALANAANAQHAADTAQDTADGKVDADYVDNAVAQAQLSVQTWLPAVQTKADLPDPSSLSHSTSYLCKVINDTDTPANNGVWQLVAGAEEWTFYSNDLDFVDETEMETAITEAVSGEASARDAAIANKMDNSSTGAITEDTNKFPASTVITFANFFKAVVAKINGIITALGTKQNTLVSGNSIKTINGTSVLGSGNIAVTAANFGGYRQDFFNVNSGTQFTLSLNTSWGNNSRCGILQIMASAEYANGYAKVFIACNSGTANSYAAQILETYQSTVQSNDHLFEAVSAAGGLLTIKVLNPDTRYSQKIHMSWDAQSDWPLTKV